MFYRVFFNCSALKLTMFQETLWKFLHLELFGWDLLCNLTLRTSRGGTVRKNALYISLSKHLWNFSTAIIVYLTAGGD